MRVYVFPDQVTIKKHLLTSGVWGDHYLKQKGVDEIVCKEKNSISTWILN